MIGTIDRRTLLAASPLAAAFISLAGRADAEAGAVPPLRTAVPFPLGVCASTGAIGDPAAAGLIVSNFAQVTPEWEMKMEAILRDDGTFDFARADAVAAFAARNGLRLHAHTLVWYEQSPIAFQRIDGNAAAFRNAYRNYIAAVAGRYRGRAVSWDVVNEAVQDGPSGALRECLWSRNLGFDYIADAFHLARAADPGAVLFLNDYGLEYSAGKRAGFLRLAERLLKAGAPLGGLGTQTHIGVDLNPGAITTAMQDLASLGLPIHVSELDISIRTGRASGAGERQARLAHEVAAAFMRLPDRQRFAVTLWGLRDRDSWLRRPPHPPGDQPLFFDDAGRPKPVAAAFLAGANGR
jgi:endo-1,4-beta-xylanase